MHRSAPHPAGQAGFTVIETMVAAVVLLVGLVSTLTVITQAAAVTGKTRTREQATSLQREVVEAARSVPYDQLAPNTAGATIRTRPALGDSSLSDAGWTVRRRNATYTIAVGVCTVDDPGDGVGPHEAGVFCASGAASAEPADANLDGSIDGLTNPAATACSGAACTDTRPADYKRIVSLVTWSRGSNVQSSQINNPGLAGAPAVTSLVAATNTVTDTRTALDLTATTSGAPQTVALYLDGTAITPAFSPSGTAWTDAWALGQVSTGAQPSSTEVVDGSYQLSAKAFDQYGQYGATRSQTITVNRRLAFAPVRVEAGRNANAVEIEWSPAKEHDSVGFRVDRRTVTSGSPGSWEMVCERKVRTMCRDTTAPAEAAGKSLEYSVVGFDSDSSGAAREGSRSEVVAIVDPAPAAPAPPGSLTATLTGGNVELGWTVPATGDADHYNIYRDGRGYEDRLDRVYVAAGQPLTFTDTGTTGQLHDYWITAVNAQLGESTAVGPVRR